jgi:hypothetical protein
MSSRPAAGPANRLAGETSPYLLQHAHNPVDWYPWAADAFDAARERDVPIFLSVGYSTCYWCHVMERESFEDPEVGERMSRDFVCIKVDREERPDVDDVYMTALQLMTRSGGWPMNVWLTPPGARGDNDPGLEPFYCGTYFPKTDMYGRPSFTTVLRNIASAWRDQREQVLDQAGRLAHAIRESLSEDAEAKRLDTRHVGLAVEALLRIHDRTNGGFGGAPKFPQPVFTTFLLEVGDSIEEPANRDAVQQATRRTLDAMAVNGMYDHVGGGFHRYSVDERWIVPHFEKMLYDNGQLLTAYARAYGRDRQAFDERVLRDVASYVGREMTARLSNGATGPFFSAQHAEADGREGLNYLWTTDEIDQLAERGELSADDAAFAKRLFGLDQGPNFQDPHHSDEPPRNVLVLGSRHEQRAAEFGVDTHAFLERFERIRAVLYRVRKHKPQPGLDDKIIVSWNGLMIRGLADACAQLLDNDMLAFARGAADWTLANMLTADGDLRRTARAERSGEFTINDTPAFFEDFAMLASGLLSLRHACRLMNAGGEEYIDAARRLVDAARERFGEGEHKHIMHETRDGQPDMLVRKRGVYDGAMPSAVGVWINTLIDLHQETGERWYLEYAELCLGAVSQAVRSSPVGCIESVRALFRLLELDGSLPDKLGPEGEDPERQTPVAVMAATERVELPAGDERRVPLKLDIGDGFHVNAATIPEKLEEIGLKPLNVRIERGAGVDARLHFPPGDEYTGGAIDDDTRRDFGTLFVYTRETHGELVLSRPEGADITGTPTAVMEYQVCAEDACYSPMTVELDIEIAPV